MCACIKQSNCIKTTVRYLSSRFFNFFFLYLTFCVIKRWKSIISFESNHTTFEQIWIRWIRSLHYSREYRRLRIIINIFTRFDGRRLQNRLKLFWKKLILIPIMRYMSRSDGLSYRKSVIFYTRIWNFVQNLISTRFLEKTFCHLSFLVPQQQ